MTFLVSYLEAFCKSFSDSELEQRVQFAYEVMCERMISLEVHENLVCLLIRYPPSSSYLTSLA